MFICIDAEMKILGMAWQYLPNLFPGIWYAMDGEENRIGSGGYTNRTFAMRRVEKEIGGCPGLTPPGK
jgi:hypothetical protein